MIHDGLIAGAPAASSQQNYGCHAFNVASIASTKCLVEVRHVSAHRKGSVPSLAGAGKTSWDLLTYAWRPHIPVFAMAWAALSALHGEMLLPQNGAFGWTK
jgi:hypothetical protein